MKKIGVNPIVCALASDAGKGPTLAYAIQGKERKRLAIVKRAGSLPDRQKTKPVSPHRQKLSRSVRGR